jgi:branched-chain amino acid transport system substrate-binding protein
MAAVNGAAAAVVVLLAGLTAACVGSDDGVEPVASGSCAELLYEGEGEPDVVVVSDLPRRGVGGPTAKVMIDAIELVLRKRDFRAGNYRVGYQSCNDTVGEEPFDAPLCRRNAAAYVATEDVVGVIGPWNSGCAFEQVPIVSRREAGPLAMVSPSASNPELTRPGLSEELYGDGVRSYTRVVTHDFVQGAAAAHLAERLGSRKAVVLHQGLEDLYVRYLTESFLAAAPPIGLEAVPIAWPFRTSYVELAESVASERPDAVYLAGLTVANADTLVADLRAALPPSVELIAPDGFAFAEVAQEIGRPGDGMFVTVPGIPSEMLPPAGQRFLHEFGTSSDEPGFLGASEAAQAADVLLDAIERSDGTRASVVEELFATKMENGILGSFSFDRFGDIDPAPVGVYRYEGGKVLPHSVVRAPLDAAGG